MSEEVVVEEPATPTITIEEFTALKETVSKLEANNKTLLQEKLEIKKAAELSAQEAAKSKGDLDAYAKSLRETEFEPLRAENEQLKAALDEATIGMVIKDIEKDVFISPKVDHGLKSRLAKEVIDGKAVVRVLDKEGRPTAMTIEQLKDEYRSSPEYAPFVIGSKANGSGGVGGKGNQSPKTMSRTDFDALDPVARMKFIKEDKGSVV